MSAYRIAYRVNPMTHFEFLMVLVSIIVGLGVAEILTGIARQLRWRECTNGYWVHSCGVALVFLALLQTWWELWGLHSTSEWAFYYLLLMLIAPAALYLIAHLIFPAQIQNTDFKKYYYENMRPVWWLAVIATTSSTLWRPLAFGSEFITWDNVSSPVLFVGFIVLANSRNQVIHATIVPAFLALILWDIIRWHPIVGST